MLKKIVVLHIFAFLLCFVGAIGFGSRQVYAEDLLSQDGCYRYQILDEEATVIGITEVMPGAIDSNGGCTVPDKIDGYEVVQLAEELFAPNDENDFRYQLKAVILPEGITEIPRYCFFHCENLMSVHFPSTLTAIKSNAFNTCTSLREIQFPLSVRDFYSGAFWYTSWLYEQRQVREDHLVIVNNVVVDGRACEGNLVIPDGVVEIAQTAFYGPEHMHSGLDLTSSPITGITMPETMECVGSVSFYGCDQLETVKFADNINYIGLQAFYGCTALKELTLPKNIQTVKGSAFQGTKDLAVTIPSEVVNFSGLNVLDLSQDVKFRVYKGSLAESFLTGSGIEYEVLSNNDDTKVNIKIGDELFYKNAYYIVTGKNSVQLKKLKKDVESFEVRSTISVGGKNYKVTRIKSEAFKGNKKLKKIVIGANVSKIGDRAFYKCSNLKDITFKSKVMERIGKQAFRGVPSKAVVTVPKNMKTTYQRLLKKAK